MFIVLIMVITAICIVNSTSLPRGPSIFAWWYPNLCTSMITDMEDTGHGRYRSFFSDVYVSKPIFTISPPPIITIFLNKSILKSLLAWSLREGQFSFLDFFVRQCRHDIDRLNHSRRKKPSNLSTDELLTFKSLRSRTDVINPADKGDVVVVWRADLYRLQEALRQHNDASFYSKLNFDPTLCLQKTVKTTISHFIQDGDLPASASNLFTTTPRTPVIYFLPKIHKPYNPGRPKLSYWTHIQLSRQCHVSFG